MAKFYNTGAQNKDKPELVKAFLMALEEFQAKL